MPELGSSSNKSLNLVSSMQKASKSKRPKRASSDGHSDVSFLENLESDENASAKASYNKGNKNEAGENDELNNSENSAGEGDCAKSSQQESEDQRQQKIFSDGTVEFRSGISHGMENIFYKLRDDLDRKELHAKMAETEMNGARITHFNQRMDEHSLTCLKRRQKQEIAHANTAHAAKLAAAEVRHRTHVSQESINSMAENSDIIIQVQDKLQNDAAAVKVRLDDMRTNMEEYLRHIKEMHTRDRKQLSRSQERRIQDQKRLIELETANISEDQRVNRTKAFQFKITQQKAMDKRIGEQLCTAQELEVKQIKERVDLELRAFEEIEQQKSQHAVRLTHLRQKHRTSQQEAQTEINNIRHNYETALAYAEHQADIERCATYHRAEFVQTTRLQAEKKKEREKRLQAVLENLQNSLSNHSLENMIPVIFPPEDPGVCTLAFELALQGVFETTTGSSNPPELSTEAATSIAPEQNDKNLELLHAEGSDRPINANPEVLKQQLGHAEHELSNLIAKNARQYQKVSRSLEASFRDAVVQLRQRIRNLHETHVREIENLRKEQLEELKMFRSQQEREALMEKNIFNTEKNMLVERRRLDMMFQTIVDGIIIINTKGIIQTYNIAAERIFGWSANEVIGKNISVLQPESIGQHHDEYINRFLATGVGGVVGSVRRVEGKHKDGHLVPVDLSLSEVKAEGIHKFTAVIRDLSKEDAAKRAAAKEAQQRENRMKQVAIDIGIEEVRFNAAIQSLLPTSILQQLSACNSLQDLNRAVPNATVMFVEICGFTEVVEGHSPEEILTLLDDITTIFEDVSKLYDVCRIESVGNTFVYVAGTMDNKKTHVLEICKCAMHMQRAVEIAKMRNYEDFKVRLRIGLHTGPVVAAIVGHKAPKYRILGDTVLLASRIKSATPPSTIQMSSECYQELSRIPKLAFQAPCRGEIEIKGRPNIVSYVLQSIRDFNPEILTLRQIKARNPIMTEFRQPSVVDLLSSGSKLNIS